MKSMLIFSRALLGILGVSLLALGVLFWTGHALTLVTLHMSLGYVFVALLWVMAALAARAHAPIGLVVVAFLWGLIIPVLGIGQVQMLAGPNHWMVRVLHLLVGVVGMGLAGTLSAHVARASGVPLHRMGPQQRTERAS